MLGDRAHAAEQGPCQVVLGQDVTQVAEYLGGGVGQLVQQVQQQPRADLVATDPPGGRPVPGELGDLLAPQPGRPPPRSLDQPHVRRTHAVTRTAEGIGELPAIDRHMDHSAGRVVGPSGVPR
ncbi:hypothetical protein [Streptomyces virginiae]|uniref:hypothetical protein n=1 Tax=Streptomyces virginiae TaxID=1961 RepID=UPI003668E545